MYIYCNYIYSIVLQALVITPIKNILADIMQNLKNIVLQGRSANGRLNDFIR